MAGLDGVGPSAFQTGRQTLYVWILLERCPIQLRGQLVGVKTEFGRRMPSIVCVVAIVYWLYQDIVHHLGPLGVVGVQFMDVTIRKGHADAYKRSSFLGDKGLDTLFDQCRGTGYSPDTVMAFSRDPIEAYGYTGDPGGTYLVDAVLK
jgi:hypothetical protein